MWHSHFSRYFFQLCFLQICSCTLKSNGALNGQIMQISLNFGKNLHQRSLTKRCWWVQLCMTEIWRKISFVSYWKCCNDKEKETEVLILHLLCKLLLSYCNKSHCNFVNPQEQSNCDIYISVFLTYYSVLQYSNSISKNQLIRHHSWWILWTLHFDAWKLRLLLRLKRLYKGELRENLIGNSRI